MYKMRKIDISKFRNNIKKELNDLPVAITRYGKIFAYVVENLEEKQDKPVEMPTMWKEKYK